MPCNWCDLAYPLSVALTFECYTHIYKNYNLKKNMAIYEYKCEDCGHEFEEMLHFSDKDNPINAPCPNSSRPSCEGKVYLKVSMSSFQLSGLGWAKDSYGLKKEYAKPEDIRPPKVTTKYDD